MPIIDPKSISQLFLKADDVLDKALNGYGMLFVNAGQYINKKIQDYKNRSGLRGLTPGEIAMARQLYRNKIGDYSDIQIVVEHRLLGSTTTAAQVAHDEPRLVQVGPEYIAADFSKADKWKQELFMHELMHIYDLKNNPQFGEQTALGRKKKEEQGIDPYQYNIDQSFKSLLPEQRATLAMNAWGLYKFPENSGDCDRAKNLLEHAKTDLPVNMAGPCVAPYPGLSQVFSNLMLKMQPSTVMKEAGLSSSFNSLFKQPAFAVPVSPTQSLFTSPQNSSLTTQNNIFSRLPKL